MKNPTDKTSDALLQEFFQLLDQNKTKKKKILHEKEEQQSQEQMLLVNEFVPSVDPTADPIQSEEKSIIEQTVACLNRKKNSNNNNASAIGESLFTQEVQMNSPIETSPTKNFMTVDEFNKKFQYIQTQIGTLGGGGEVNFLKLDDVDSSSARSGRHLEYNPTTKHVYFTDNLYDDDYTTQIENNTVSVINLPTDTPIGPIESILFDVEHIHEEIRIPGTLCWDSSDRTLNLAHPEGPIQQIGQETYILVKNNTDALISNGTAVRFNGAESNGDLRLAVAPFLANGAFPSLYTLGIATQDIAPDGVGFVTVWGKVRELNTTGALVGESWQIGDILYISPTFAGGFTKAKPTAPQNVIPIAAVLSVDDTNGEIFVRPTIEQQSHYARFANSRNIDIAQANVEYLISFDQTEISNGIVLGGSPPTEIVVSQSGFYQIDINAQIDETEGGLQSGVMTIWIKKNGNPVTNSARRQGVIGTAPASIFNYSFGISLNAGDVIEIAYMGSVTAMRFQAIAANSVVPAAASVIVGITQIQQ